MVKFAIVDDNKSAVCELSKKLESIIINYDFDAEIAFQTTSACELLNFTNSNKIDVLILDINLKSSINGLELAKIVRKTNKDCYFIFITAYLEYGLEAYKYKTFDFITKPFALERLENSIVRLFDDISVSTKRFLKLDNKNTFINESDVEFIKRDGMRVVFHTNSYDYEFYSSFSKLQNQLPSNFIRCHKSFIVNVNNITKIVPNDNLIFLNSSFCDIGPKYKSQFLEVMKNYEAFK